MDSDYSALSMNFFLLRKCVVSALSGFGVAQGTAQTFASFQQVIAKFKIEHL